MLFLQATQPLNDFAKGITNLGTAINGSLASTNDAVTAEMQALADEIVDWMADSLVLQPLPELPAAGRTINVKLLEKKPVLAAQGWVFTSNTYQFQHSSPMLY